MAKKKAYPATGLTECETEIMLTIWKYGKDISTLNLIKNYNEHVDDSLKLPMISIHCLRHTNATLLIASDIDVKTISSRLGHSKCATTLDIYTHSLKERDKKASEALDNILSEKNA